MKNLLLLSVLALLMFSCSTNSESSDAQFDIAGLDGKTLMENNCFSCHNTRGTDNMLAPPMQRVKDHYWNEDITKKEFINAISDWCENPTEEKSVMHGAKRKFGLMPKQEFDRKEVQAIANYLFENNLDEAGCCHNCE